MAWENCIHEGRIEIVFANRNKSYGAYIIRKKYTLTTVRAFLTISCIIIIVTCFPLIMSFLSTTNDKVMRFSETEITLMQPPPIDETQPPPPPIPPPPPVQQTIKFTPPVVVKDEEVIQDEPPPTADELKETNVGLTTREGEAGAIELPTDVAGEGDAVPEIFTIVEEMPSFSGGESNLVKFLSDNIRYPSRARENGISGTVFVTFIIGKDGKVTDAKVLRGIGGGCDEEALRVIGAMPTWRPGKQRGEPVSVQFNLPIRFTLK